MPDRIPLLRYEYCDYDGSPVGTYVPAQDDSCNSELSGILYNMYDSFVNYLKYEYYDDQRIINKKRKSKICSSGSENRVKFLFKCGGSVALTVWYPISEKHLEIIDSNLSRKDLYYLDIDDDFDDDFDYSAPAYNSFELNRLIDALAEFERSGIPQEIVLEHGTDDFEDDDDYDNEFQHNGTGQSIGIVFLWTALIPFLLIKVMCLKLFGRK